MALFSTTNITQAQIPLSCQFCETSRDIKWKCLDCALLLCESCKQRLHSKVKSGKLHHIVDIGNFEVVQNTDGSQTAAQSSCHQHPQQMCCLFCKSCEKPICPICLLGVHKNHKWAELLNTSVDNKALSDEDDSSPPPIPSRPTPGRPGKRLPPVPSPRRPLPPSQVEKALSDDDDSPPSPIPSRLTPRTQHKGLPSVPSHSRPLPPRQVKKALPDDDDSPPSPIPSRLTPRTQHKGLPSVPSHSRPLPPRQVKKSDDYMNRYSWYFGEISRTIGIMKLLEFNQNGAYLLRKSKKGGDKHPYTLMVMYQNNVYNLKVRGRDDGRVALGQDDPNETTYGSVEKLIMFHQHFNITLKIKEDHHEYKTLLLKCPPK